MYNVTRLVTQLLSHIIKYASLYNLKIDDFLAIYGLKLLLSGMVD